ncbi:MAG: fatty acyl-AMP ligase [Hyphomicrobiales bacterium]
MGWGLRVESNSGISLRSREADILRPAPTTHRLAQRLGTFDTLAEGLDYAARGETGFTFYSARGAVAEVLTYADLRDRALRMAHRLVNSGLKKGDRVAVVAETGAQFMDVFFGCQYAGLVPCPVPYTMQIGGRESYVERLAGMMRSAAVSLAVTPADLLPHLQEAAAMAHAPKVMTHEELSLVPAYGAKLRPMGKDEVAYIQYSSGSTSAPKGVLISQRAITANVRGILQHGLKVSPADRAFSWLPLYHDMGLVGFCLSPMMGQVSVDYLATTSFARRPNLWLKLMSENRCTVSYSPSFGYDLAGRRVTSESAGLDLSAWRIAGIGGDMVRNDVLQTFAKAYADCGFDAKAFLPSYGMAESTLAITFCDLDKPPRVDVVDRAHYKLSRRAVPASVAAKLSPERTRTFIACGRPMPGHRVEIRDDNGRVLGDREIGHILVSGPSLMSGYFRNVDATAAVMGEDGFMDTGDMGYWLDGEIVITGRAKDLILHNGRNIWPQDIEWAAEQIEPLRSGDAAAFAVEGKNDTDEVVVLVQCRLNNPDAMEALRRQIAAKVHQAAGVECEVVLVPPKSLPFTSSGKLSRAAAKKGYLAGEIAEISQRYADALAPEPELAALAG